MSREPSTAPGTQPAFCAYSISISTISCGLCTPASGSYCVAGDTGRWPWASNAAPLVSNCRKILWTEVAGHPWASASSRTEAVPLPSPVWPPSFWRELCARWPPHLSSSTAVAAHMHVTEAPSQAPFLAAQLNSVNGTIANMLSLQGPGLQMLLSNGAF